MKINPISSDILEIIPKNLYEGSYLLNFCLKSGIGEIYLKNKDFPYSPEDLKYFIETVRDINGDDVERLLIY